MELLYRLYVRLFGRKSFYRFNRRLFLLGLRGMGVRNHASENLNGEKYLLDQLSAKEDLKVVFDVGAHQGKWSAYFKGKELDLHAFEPNPLSFQKLCANLKDQNFKLNGFGLAATSGEKPLYDLQDKPGSSLASLHLPALEAFRNLSTISSVAEFRTLDEYCKAHHISQIDLLKIDTEGYELEVLKGASAMLSGKSIRFIQFEFNLMNIYSGVHFQDFTNFLKDYELFRLLPKGLLPFQIAIQWKKRSTLIKIFSRC